MLNSSYKYPLFQTFTREKKVEHKKPDQRQQDAGKPL